MTNLKLQSIHRLSNTSIYRYWQ